MWAERTINKRMQCLNSHPWLYRVTLSRFWHSSLQEGSIRVDKGVMFLLETSHKCQPHLTQFDQNSNFSLSLSPLNSLQLLIGSNFHALEKGDYCSSLIQCYCIKLSRFIISLAYSLLSPSHRKGELNCLAELFQVTQSGKVVIKISLQLQQVDR